MFSGLQIVATSGILGVGATPKAGYIEGVIGTTPVGNAYTFSGSTFGWLCPRPVSLLTAEKAFIDVAKCRVVRESLARSDLVAFC